MSEEIPESRNYVHMQCGTVTSVSGNDFTALADPFSVVPATYCVGCEKHFPLDQFTWEDTDELISDARERLAARAPAWARFASGQPGCFGVMLFSIALGLLGGFGVSLLLGGAFEWIGPIAGALLGAFGGMIVFGAFVLPYIMRRFYNVESYRQLK